MRPPETYVPRSVPFRPWSADEPAGKAGRPARDTLHVLLLEDNPDDAELIEHALTQAGLHGRLERVCTREAFLEKLSPRLDLILSDHTLPQFDALSALGLLQEQGLEIPFIIVSGTISEEAAVEAMKQGAADYLLKDRLARLAPAVEHALLQRRLRQEKHQAEDTLNRLNDQLRAANARLQEANRQLTEGQAQLVHSEKMASLGQLAAGIAHEINNPVGFVMSNLETMAGYVDAFNQLLDAYGTLTEAVRREEPHRYRDILDRVARIDEEEDVSYIREDVPMLVAESLTGMHRVKEIVQSLKSFARVDDAVMQEADINEGIEATLRVIWNELKYKCEVHTRLGTLPRIRCYPGQLNQVFMNLLVNAAHAIPERGTVTVETCATETDVVIRIRDTGIGIAPEHLPKLFTPFFTTKPVGTGTGLGLSISYGIIQKHRGRIDVESEVGQGTCFTIRLPITGGDHE